MALKKSREAQSAVLVTRATGVQATAWDISDTFRALDEVGSVSCRSVLADCGSPPVSPHLLSRVTTAT